MTDTPPLATQTLRVTGPCLIQREYADEDLQVVPLAARRLLVFNLGPGFLWMESLSVEDAQGILRFLPLGTPVAPGTGQVVLSAEEVALLTRSRERGAYGDPFRLRVKVAVPGELVELPFIVKPYQIAREPAPYFGLTFE